MKWYFWVIIAVVAIVIISIIVYKTKTKKSTELVEGSECIIPTSNRTAVNNTLPVVPIVGMQGVIVNGICVKR